MTCEFKIVPQKLWNVLSVLLQETGVVASAMRRLRGGLQAGWAS